MARNVATPDQLKRLRAESYYTREQRIERAKEGTSTLVPYTTEELQALLPGRKIEWLSNVGHLTSDGGDLWAEHEAVIAVDATQRLVLDEEKRLIHFQDREWQSRTVRWDMVFTLTIRPQPPRAAQKETRRQTRTRMTRRIAV